MKGFIRILEAFIASIILFTSLTYFFDISSYDFWGSATLRTTVQDSLTTFYLNDDFNTAIFNNDKIQIKNELTKILPTTTNYLVEIGNIPSPEIKVHCVCTQEASAQITEMLLAVNGFFYKGRTIKILIGTDPDIKNVDGAADLILFLDFDEIKDEKPLLRFWQNNGKNLMLFTELRESTFTSDTNDVLKDIFDLEWKSSANAASGNAEFIGADDVKKNSYKIGKYFEKSSTYAITEDFNFPKIDSSTLLNRIVNDDDTIIKNLHAQSDKEYSFVQVKNTKGRATWFADYDGVTDSITPGTPDNDDINKLLRSVIMWSSGEQYVLVDGGLPSLQPYTSYDLFGSIEGDPYSINILIWSVFY